MSPVVNRHSLASWAPLVARTDISHEEARGGRCFTSTLCLFLNGAHFCRILEDLTAATKPLTWAEGSVLEWVGRHDVLGNKPRVGGMWANGTTD